jgi:hypothetical protein
MRCRRTQTNQTNFERKNKMRRKKKKLFMGDWPYWGIERVVRSRGKSGGTQDRPIRVIHAYHDLPTHFQTLCTLQLGEKKESDKMIMSKDEMKQGTPFVVSSV